MESTKKINEFDFVELNEAPGKYYFLKEIIADTTAIVVGMGLNSTHDGVTFYSEKININSLSRVSDYFINVIGPLYRLRESMRGGYCNMHIEER